MYNVYVNYDGAGVTYSTRLNHLKKTLKSLEKLLNPLEKIA